MGASRSPVWRYRAAATLLAMAGVAATIYVFRVLFVPSSIQVVDLWYLGAILVAFTGVFSFVVFGLLAIQHAQLNAANTELKRRRDVLQGLWDATGVVASLPDVDTILQRIVDVSRSLFDAEYAALAVLTDSTDPQIRQFITSGMSEAVRCQIGQLPTGRGLLGEVIRTKRVMRLEEIREHPASIGFPLHHPAMDSFLGVPLLYRSSVVGHLYLTNKVGGFTSQDEMLAELFARQAAMVISNARLYQDRETWATVAERERIGRELHDGVLQTLYGLTLSLEYLLDAETTLSQAAEGELHRITETLSLTMTDIRMYIQSLGTTPVDLKLALTDMLKRSGGMDDLRWDFRNNEYLVLKPEVVHDLVLSVQEAVSNARRHGESKSVTIGWDTTDFEYQLWIQDEGRGFDDSMEWGGQHYGLVNMRRRMESWDGVMDISSQVGLGTLVMFRLPKSIKLRMINETP